MEDLNAAAKTALQVLDRGAPLRVGGLPELGAKIGLVDKLRHSETPWEFVKFDDRYKQVREALQFWAARFNLRDEWILNLALEYLCPIWSEQLAFRPVAKSDLRVLLIGWDPTVETRAQASARMHERVEAYLDQVEKRAVDDGLERTPERRQPLQLSWLARYQVCRWSRNRIAGAAGTDRAAVVRAINSWAKFLGLTLRPSNW